MNWWRTDATHDPALTCWVEGAQGHADFPIQNLPFGLFSPADGGPRAGVAIGEHILDLTALAEGGLLPAAVAVACREVPLNALLALAPADRRALRAALSGFLSDESRRATVEPALHAAGDCALHLPVRVGDYTDFYVGIHHATNIGRLFRPENPLLPNYKHVPIGYHGRASSIRPSGTPLVRPKGQVKGPADEAPAYRPTARLDYELELGVWIGAGNALGTPVPIAEAARHIGGFCLLNDWSARDFQAWEYQPLGPFLAKNFHSSVSPWIVTPEALAPFRIAQPPRPDGDPKPLSYLWDEADQSHGALALELVVLLETGRMRQAGLPPVRLSHGPASNMYWTVQQLVAHHSANGCNLAAGDLLGTGTISAPSRDGFGSLMELTVGGKEPLELGNGETRGFLEDGDTIILRATASAPGRVSIGFGECRATVLPAR
ncbi:fumarylacetoacetase [Sandaracinobacter sp. RS1-74]|uniref:fumarylacetoacetase n=1 Tax=Sandaracinobacteroides sayramensis TaxID=2913411 RepID=UPI001EDB92D3|nr:fumarylacetoacetase [Sandaracinobacteroides sayramensis]MCG2842070.1 fumarylacetoacetase [Sandaracinobacteroides sayramensis]